MFSVKNCLLRFSPKRRRGGFELYRFLVTGLFAQRFCLSLHSQQGTLTFRILKFSKQIGNLTKVPTGRNKSTWKSHDFKSLNCKGSSKYSLINMRQLQILFNYAKTWHRIVCRFQCFYQFLHVIIKLFCFDLQNNFLIRSCKNCVKTGKFS